MGLFSIYGLVRVPLSTGAFWSRVSNTALMIFLLPRKSIVVFVVPEVYKTTRAISTEPDDDGFGLDPSPHPMV